MRHRIWKQTIECTLSDPDPAWDIQNRISALFRTRALPVLASHFDRIAPESSRVVIDTLECDLGEIDPAHMDAQILAALNEALPRSLADALAGAGEKGLARATQAGRPDTGSHPDPTLPEEQGTESTTVQDRHLTRLLVYLATGTVAWHRDIPDWQAFLEETLAALAHIGSLDRTALARVLDGEAARIRLAGQFPTEFTATCILAAWPDAVPAVRLAEELAGPRDLSDPAGPANETALPTSPLNRKILYLALIDWCRRHPPADTDGFAAFAARKLDQIRPSASRRTGLGERNGAISENGPKPDKKEPRPAGDIYACLEGTAPVPAPAGTGKTGGRPDAKAHSQSVPDYSIPNAGLVLAWPFLPQFFSALSLVDKDRAFPSHTAAVSALAALHVLVYGPVHPAEYACSLNKLLCGIPMDTPLIFEPETDLIQADLIQTDLIQAEKEARHLIREIIRHWTALKNASVEGLRSTFLRRDAILRKTDGLWTLQVEWKGADVLLDALPWSSSLIQTPWMDSPLEVQWGEVQW